MKVMTVSRVNETHRSAMKESLPEKRSVTDKYILVALFFIVMLFFGLATLFDVHLRIPDAKVVNAKMVASVNESSMDCMALNTSLEVIYDTFLSTFTTLTNEKSLIISFTFKAVIGLLYLTPVGIISFFMKCYIMRIAKLSTPRVPDYSSHFTVVFTGKIISTWIFLIAMYFYWTDVSQVLYMTLIASLENIMFLKSNFACHTQPPNKFKNKMKTLKTTLRYYLDHRYLILFRFLNYLIIVLLIKYVVNIVHDFSRTFALVSKLGMLFTIYFMHDYGKMVIILSRASHSWEYEYETISLKTLLSSMITISRYHCGTIVMNVPAMGLFFPIDYNDDICEFKNLMMFTAVHGQDYSKAVESIRYFKKRNQLVTNFENKISSVWTDVLVISLFSSLCFVSLQSFLSTAENLFAAIPILVLYVSLIGSYYYVFINTMNTVENTIAFCNTIKSEDIKAMYEEELCQKIRNTEKSIVTPASDKINEKGNYEINVNKEKLELPEDSNIA